MNGPLLTVEDLAVGFPAAGGFVRAVNGVSLSLSAGERVGIAGESGAGKSVTALAIMGLLPVPPTVVTGAVRHRGKDLLTMRERDLRLVRGRSIAMIFQDPVTCLNPRLSVGRQVVEAIRAHEPVSRREARGQAIELLGRAGIPAPARRFDDYPHTFSGGMAQRVMIAIALSCGPEIVLADEPTTALDVTIEAQIVDLLVELCDEQQAAVMFITHDLALLARFADRILVMYGGRIMEQAPAPTIFRRTAHPYTRGLLSSVVRPDGAGGARLATIPGAPPSPLALPPGCPFHPRCVHAVERCRTEVPLLLDVSSAEHRCACHLAAELTPFDAAQPDPLGIRP